MKKRQFLSCTAGLMLGALGSAGNNVNAKEGDIVSSPVILTITGNIRNKNRKKFDSVTDQLMARHGIHFDAAFALSLVDLQKLNHVSISPTLEYDAKVHKLSGPRLLDVLNLAGVKKATGLVLHGIDGYSPEIDLAFAQSYDYILATKMDGEPLSTGGLGPLFAIFDADRYPTLAEKPLKERFAKCPWGLYCIEVR